MSWHVAPDADTAARQAFADLDAVFALEGAVVALDSLTRTLRVEIGGRGYYVKRYAGLGNKPLRRLFATPRVRLEWENLRHFADWGIPTAHLVAYGLERRGGRFVRGALITAEIADTIDLARLARIRDPRLQSRPWVDGVSRQLADIARRMHAHRFAHGDFKWRNLLVDGTGKLFLIDCPSGAFWWPPFLEYRIVKDLACLDKVAQYQLTRTRRLRFYLDYAGKRSLDPADKQRIRKIVRFFEGRESRFASAASLRAAGRAPPVSSRITFDNGQLLTIERWLRILPGKRLTGLGEWCGRKVIAKLFIAARGSERHWRHECDGIASLRAMPLPTPELLARGRLEGEGHYVLTAFVENAHNPDPAKAEELRQVFAVVGRMHAGGLLQEDAHFANFLVHPGGLLVIDGDAVRPVRDSRDALDNLALLFAQLDPVAATASRTDLLAAYRSGHPQAVIDEDGLVTAIDRARHARLDNYLGKCLRDCSLFKVAQRADRFVSIVRAEAGLLLPIIHDPDALLKMATPLKQGRTATLGLVEVQARRLVIKRYNIKNAGHALSRCWRPSRAWHSWIEGHRLQFLGIATPRPLALVEQRLGPLRGKAWLITEHCPGGNLADLLAERLDAPPADVVAALGHLFDRLAAARISHGDLKATNLLWHEGRVHLVDLDAMRQHDNDASFARAWRKDRERFLKNWPAGSALRLALEQALPAP